MASKEVSTEAHSGTSDEGPFQLAPVILAIGIAISAVLPVFLTGALAVQIRQNLNFTPSLLGSAVAVFFLFAALGSFVSGHISHRVDGSFVIKSCMLFSFTVLAAIGIAGVNYPTFVALLALGGAVNGALQPHINLFLSHVIPKRRQGFAFGVKQAAVPLATFLAGLAVPAIALTIGWRYAFLSAAPLGLIFFFLAPKSVQMAPGRTGTAKLAGRPSAAPLVMLALGMGLGTGAANSFGAFVVSFAVHSGWKPGLAGLLIVFGSAIGVLARIGNGLAADKRHGQHFLVAACSVAVGGLGYLMFSTTDSWMIIPATVICYGAGWGWNGLFIFGIVRNFPRHAGYATGTVQSGAYIGSVLGPLAFGFIVEAHGYQMAWILAASAAVCAALAVWIARRSIIASQPEAVG